LEETNGYRGLHAENTIGLVAEINTFSMLHIASLATRTQSSPIARAAVFLALILIPSLSSAAIYKCTAQDGAITYTDTPCAPDTKSQPIDPATPAWLIEGSAILNTTAAVPDAQSQSQPEILATLCATDEFAVWLKAQRHSLPEADTRTAKFIRLSKLCRRALHLPDVAASVPESPPKPVLASAAGAE
jgi:Domain of unknown function (DUF4124)